MAINCLTGIVFFEIRSGLLLESFVDALLKGIFFLISAIFCIWFRDWEGCFG